MKGALNVISLCSGIGGLDLGLRLAEPRARTVCYVEREAYLAACMVQRMQDGILDRAPIHSDLTTFDGEQWSGVVDIVTAGFPCQPFSVAGHALADKDPRHLWPHVLRVFRQSQAKILFFENVRGLVSRGLRQVLEDVAKLGAHAEWDMFSAAETGAPHKRDRLFCVVATDEGREILADSDSYVGRQGRASDSAQGSRRGHLDRSGQQILADSDCKGLAQRPFSAKRKGTEEPVSAGGNWWASEPAVGRVAYGVGYRAHRIRACGNGVVVAVAARAWCELTGRLLT